jgi:uncharacterized protein (TIGR02001 family)
MKKLVVSVVAASLLSATASFAADMPWKAKAPEPYNPWDWAFGGALLSDYNFRGISQSNRGPSVTAYSETRYNANANLQYYVGSQYWAVTLPTDPTCECDLYGGVRPTIGAFAFDFGYIYYWYPKERAHNSAIIAPFPTYPNGNSTLRQTDYGEVYGKVTWDVVKDKFALGGNVYYSPSWLNTGAPGTYASVTAKYSFGNIKTMLPWVNEVGVALSGEYGHYFLGNTNFFPAVFAAGFNLPDYNTWNVGLAFTYKVATLDLRYYDTDLSKANCNVLTGDQNATIVGGVTVSKWCSSTFIGALKFDLTAMTNLK